MVRSAVDQLIEELAVMAEMKKLVKIMTIGDLM